MNDPAPTIADVVEDNVAAGNEPEVEAPSIKEVVKNIQANYAFDVDVRPTMFHFKSQKDPETGISTKRDSVELALPFLSVQGIIDILEGENGKDAEGNEIDKNHDLQMELMRDALDTIIIQNARQMLTENEGITAANLPVEKLSWEFIANMPKPERTGGGIPKETWEAFVEDYRAVMPEAAGKTDEQVAAAGKILLNKFAAVKTNIPVLEMLQGQLAIYAEASEDIENYLPCVEFLLDKADKLVNVSPEELLASL